jgi:hypothetical protein
MKCYDNINVEAVPYHVKTTFFARKYLFAAHRHSGDTHCSSIKRPVSRAITPVGSCSCNSALPQWLLCEQGLRVPAPYFMLTTRRDNSVTITFFARHRRTGMFFFFHSPSTLRQWLRINVTAVLFRSPLKSYLVISMAYFSRLAKKRTKNFRRHDFRFFFSFSFFLFLFSFQFVPSVRSESFHWVEISVELYGACQSSASPALSSSF